MKKQGEITMNRTKEKLKRLEAVHTHTHNSIRNKIIYIAVLSILSLLLALLCFSNPFSKVGTATDSSVFIYIAKRINEGELPYRDYFDHKGPILYLINWVGVNFCGGIWLIEYLTILITVLFTQKILKKVFEFNDLEASFLNLVINSNLIFFLTGGNYTELYALPVITLALYLMLTIRERDKKRYHFFIGLLMGLVFCLRANMIAVWLTYYLMVTMKCLKNKKVKEFLSIFIYSSLGFLSVLGIMAIFLAKLDILKECIECYLLFNLKYAVYSQRNLLSIVNYFVLSSNSILYFVILLFLGIMLQKLKLFSLCYMLLSFAIVLQPRNPFLHYGIILVPTFIIPIANLYSWLKKNLKEKISRNVVIITFLSCLLIWPLLQYLVRFTMINRLGNIKSNKIEVAQYITANSLEKDKILVVGNDCEIYLLTNRIAASKYLYQTPIYKVDSNLLKQLLKDIEENKPQLIIVGEKQINELAKGKEELEEFIVSNIKEDYSLRGERCDEFKIYQRN